MCSKYTTLKITYKRNKLHCLWAPIFLAIWALLYYFIVICAFHNLPEPLEIANDLNETSGLFIGERAERNLQLLVKNGPRIVGTAVNEQATVQFIVSEIESIQRKSNPVHQIDIDVQDSSGSFILFEKMINVYQGIQNIVVKLSPTNPTTNATLLINSHFDSVPGSPGAGDDGTMVVVMLEVLRVLANSEKPLQHSVIFLFNGAEETGLQGSHGFITQHKWAKDIKAFINLDSAGNGGREILFQSGPSHPWLMKYYGENAKHPFASTLAEELFQNNFIPSDTDFRIFRDHGKIPGLDFAQSYNGYVYHTKYDQMKTIPRATYQNTGDNLLKIVNALANSPELENPAEHAEGHSIFFDVLGYYLVRYTEMEGLIINCTVAIIGFITICLSIWCMKRNSGLFMRRILSRFTIIFMIQLISLCLAASAAIGVAFILDLLDFSMSWYSNPWMVIGLYFCPIMFCLEVIPSIYLGLTKENGLSLSHRIQLFMHSHCIILIVVLLLLTGFNIRSAFLIMISILFYTISLLINLITTMHNRPFLWIFTIIIGQIIPFLFYSYMAHTLFTTFIPMAGRSSSLNNPDILIAAISILFGILIGGFLVPLMSIFRKTKLLNSLFFIATVVFLILAITPVGFPYKAETSPQRFWVMHTKRILHDFNGTIRRNDSGYFMVPQDRQSPQSIKYCVLNMSLAENIDNDCDDELFCGVPLYSTRMVPARHLNYWIPSQSPKLIRAPSLRLYRKQLIDQKPAVNTLRYEFVLSGPNHMGIFLEPLPDCKLTQLSFIDNNILNELTPPYFISFIYGIDAKPLKFSIDLEKNTQNLSAPCFDIAVTGHLKNYNIYQTDEFKLFLRSFPPWTYVTAWMSSYESFRI